MLTKTEEKEKINKIKNDVNNWLVFDESIDTAPLKTAPNATYKFSDDLQVLIFKYYQWLEVDDYCLVLNTVFKKDITRNMIRALIDRKYNNNTDIIQISSSNAQKLSINYGSEYSIRCAIRKIIRNRFTDELSKLPKNALRQQREITYRSREPREFSAGESVLINDVEHTQIKEVPHLYINKNGGVYSKKAKRYLTPTTRTRNVRTQRKQDIYIGITNYGNVPVYRLLGFIYKGDVYQKLKSVFGNSLTVDHINGDPNNIKLNNLQWLPQHINSSKGELKDSVYIVQYIDTEQQKHIELKLTSDFENDILKIIDSNFKNINVYTVDYLDIVRMLRNNFKIKIPEDKSTISFLDDDYYNFIHNHSKEICVEMITTPELKNYILNNFESQKQEQERRTLANIAIIATL